MSERGMHFIEPDLDANWLRDWIGVGVSELEAYLAKHAAFFEFLRTAGGSRRGLRPAPGTAD